MSLWPPAASSAAAAANPASPHPHPPGPLHLQGVCLPRAQAGRRPLWQVVGVYRGGGWQRGQCGRWQVVDLVLQKDWDDHHDQLTGSMINSWQVGWSWALGLVDRGWREPLLCRTHPCYGAASSEVACGLGLCH